ncbi:MAG: aspartate aminotransferase family protein [Campylobacteraceae bacterium]|nr:aspartate aminotransferase family protein [Campylobacteraceae bacterium]
MQRDPNADLPIAVKGDGIYIIDQNGKKYLDGCSGAAVSCLGHSDESVRTAIKKQIDTLAYAHTSFMTTEPAEELAHMLIEKAPDNIKKVYFLSGGSEAVETALKLIRQYHLEKKEPKRQNIIARLQSYHGNTLTTLGVGGNVKRKEPFLPYLSDCMHHINPVYAYRLKNDNETMDEYGIRAANYLEEKILELGADTVAAFVAEPLVGSTLGAVGAPKTYFKRIREICDQYGVLLLFDEIMCGTGRTGYMFASEYTQVKPDLITIAKGIGGGYQPLAATLISEKILSAIEEGSGQFSHGHTYIGHATACAAGVAVLKAFDERNLLDNVQKMGKLLKDTLKDRFKDHKNIGDIRGKGLFIGIELVKDRTTKECFDPKLQIYAEIKSTAKELGLLCYPMGGTDFGKAGDHVLLAPPFIITPEQVTELVDKLEDAINLSLAIKGVL